SAALVTPLRSKSHKLTESSYVQALIARIRWRLVGWNVLILGLILIVAGGGVYAAASRVVLGDVDRTLLTRSEQAVPILFPGPRREEFGQGGNQQQNPGGGPGIGGGGGPGRRVCEGYSGGIFCIALSPDGAVRANPQEVPASDLPWPETAQPTF